MLFGVSSLSSVCQLSQSSRLQCSIRRLVPFSISTVAIAACRHDRQRLGSRSLTMRSLVFSFCIDCFLVYSVVVLVPPPTYELSYVRTAFPCPAFAAGAATPPVTG